MARSKDQTMSSNLIEIKHFHIPISKMDNGEFCWIRIEIMHSLE